MRTTARALLREKGTFFSGLGLENPALGEDQRVGAMMEHPIMIHRLIVISPLAVKLGRPSEAVFDLPDAPQRAGVFKEDGQVVEAAAR